MTKQQRDFILKDMNVSTFSTIFTIKHVRARAIRSHLRFYMDDRMTIEGVHDRINLRGYDSRHVGVHYAGTKRSRAFEMRITKAYAFMAGW